MQILNRSGLQKRLFTIGVLTALVLFAASVGIGIWSSHAMQTTVADQFNEQQGVIARNIAGLISNKFTFLKKEIAWLCTNLPVQEPDERLFQNSFARVIESGVYKIVLSDPSARKIFTYFPNRTVSERAPEPGEARLPGPADLAGGRIWISAPQVKPSGIDLIMAAGCNPEADLTLLFYINVNWLLSPFLKEIRSGKSGYAWLIDGSGTFLFHPMAEFSGQNAFTARDQKDPHISFSRINFIQKEQMLKGDSGSGWYYSGWHRGFTGRIKKLIAYHPVRICDDPPQQWSVAVVAPVSEIENRVRAINFYQALMQGLLIAGILVGALTLLFYERRWSSTLQTLVNRRTEALTRSEQKYRSLVESAEDFIFTVTPAGQIRSLNSFTANFFGGRAEAFIGNPLTALFPKEPAARSLKLIEWVHQHGKSAREDLEIQTGGQQIWLGANFMPLKGEAGQVNTILCIARDITENKRLEKQLVNTEKLAALGTLAAGVAHEINNPLGVMLGFCDILLKNAPKESQTYEDLKIIERQGLHCKAVVENLLSFARLSKETAEFADLNRCIREIVTVVRHSLEMNAVTLNSTLAGDIPPVRGDPRQLQQVFLNLINNSAAAMPNGGLLEIRARYDKKHRKAVIRFIDTGTGIAAEHMEHIFEPFFTTKPEGQGTGLGLFVSYGIIAKYGGSIECASRTAEPGAAKTGGTTFTIQLPTHRQEGR